MLRTLRAGHRMLLRASAEDELLQSMCRVLVDEGGYRIVWIGYAEDDAAKTIRPMAHAGAEAEFFRSAHFSWDAARPSVSGGRPVVGIRNLVPGGE